MQNNAIIIMTPASLKLGPKITLHIGSKIKVVIIIRIILNGQFINGMINHWPLIKIVLKNVLVLILYANNE